MALTIMPVHAAENAAGAGYMLPHCKASLDYPPGTFIQGFCAGIVAGLALWHNRFLHRGNREVPNGA